MIALLLLISISYGVVPIPYTYVPTDVAVAGQNYACATDSYGANIGNCPWIASAALTAQDATANKTTFTFKTNWWFPTSPVCTTSAFAITSTTALATVVGNQTAFSCEGGASGCACEDYDSDGCADYCQCSGGEGDDWCCYKGRDVPSTFGYYPTTGAFTLTCHN